MNEQTHRVDVLAAIDLADAWLIEEGYNLKSRRPLKEARVAVAELMSHEQAKREALQACERWFVKHSPTAPLIGGRGDAEHPMLTMIRAALAGGASHGFNREVTP